MFGFFRKKVWSPNRQNPPWGSASSIYAHIAVHVDPARPTRLSDEGYLLPDEPACDPNKISFAPGAIDGVTSRYRNAVMHEYLAYICARAGDPRSCVSSICLLRPEGSHSTALQAHFGRSPPSECHGFITLARGAALRRNQNNQTPTAGALKSILK